MAAAMVALVALVALAAAGGASIVASGEGAMGEAGALAMVAIEERRWVMKLGECPKCLQSKRRRVSSCRA